MRRYPFKVVRCSCLALAIAIAIGCTHTFQEALTPRPDVSTLPKQFLPAQIIVILPPAPAERLAGITGHLAEIYRLVQVGMFPLNSIGIHCVVFRIPDQRSVDEVLRALRSDPLVEWAQRNQLFEVRGPIYNEPYAGLQYGPQLMRADLAHRWATGKGIKVAVIDTGIDVGHPDLQGRIAKTANFVEGGEATFSRDVHGTAVAGIIAATANNDIGIFGVAPEADILAVKACWPRSPDSRRAVCSSWTLARSIDFSIVQGAQVLNLSLVGPPDLLLARLIAKAIDRGIAAIAAASDEGEQGQAFPASLDTVIAVVAADMKGNVHLAAKVKRSPMLAAPGMEILTTAPGGSYDFFSGSSLAAAHVSGVAALLLERDPKLSPAKLDALLQATARPVETARGASKKSVRLIDACRALAKVLGIEACP